MEKKKKEKKVKKVLPSFDKIDITTATEDDIIRSGLKYNTSKDKISYFILFIIVVLAALPVILRIVIPRPITTEEAEIVYDVLTCYKTTNRDNYELSTKLVSNYRDGNVNKVVIEYTYYKRNTEAKDGYMFSEISEMEKLNLAGVTSEKQAGKYTYTIDFENHPELADNELLKNYSYLATIELNHLTGENGYSCNRDSETKKEVIYIEDRKKVE